MYSSLMLFCSLILLALDQQLFRRQPSEIFPFAHSETTTGHEAFTSIVAAPGTNLWHHYEHP